MYDLSKKTEDELLKIMHKSVETSDLHIEAKHAYNKLLRKKEFWSKNIVAWLALGVSIISLVVSIIALTEKRENKNHNEKTTQRITPRDGQ